ncbi:MAG: FG-GAP-like repeat-containing protein [Cyanobacteria bacterium J06631_12]
MTFIKRTGGSSPFNGLSFTHEIVPRLIDLDLDGDLDFVIGRDDGTVGYAENTGTVANPVYTQRNGTDNPFHTVNEAYDQAPALADIDADGDLDLLVGNVYGHLNYYRNDGTASAPNYVKQSGENHPFNGVDLASRAIPIFADLDNDGDLDAIVGDRNELHYYKNVGSASTPIFSKQTGSNNPFSSLNTHLWHAPELVDYDSDGDLDLFLGFENYVDGPDDLDYFENTGSASNPVFVQRTGGSNPVGSNILDFNHLYTTPTTGDIDNDGDLDIFIAGTGASNPSYFENRDVVVDNTPPNAIAKDITVNLDASGNASITAASVDDGSTDDIGIASLSVSQTDFNISDVGQNTVTLTVTDTSSNTATDTATVTIQDVTAPNANAKDITVQLDANGQATITGASIDDGSSDASGIASRSVSMTGFNGSNLGPNTVTLTVIDNNGNSATDISTVTVEDNIAPTVIAQDITVQLDSNGQATITGADVDGGSVDNAGIAAASVSQTNFDGSDLGTNAVVLTVTDVGGNSDTANATVTVEDTIAPTAIAQDITVQLDSNGVASITAADVDGGSTDNVVVSSISVSQTNFDSSDLGNNVVTLTATDSSGNSATANAAVTVIDEIAPILTLPDDITLLPGASSAPSIAGTATATDNVDPSVDISFSDSSPIPGLIERTWTATDDSGNSSSGVQHITAPPVDVTVGATGGTLSIDTATSGANDRIKLTQKNGVVTISSRDQNLIPGEGATGVDMHKVEVADSEWTGPIVVNLGDGKNKMNAEKLTASLSVTGGMGNDRFIGGLGDDNINGGLGKDYVRGGAGVDMLDGGDGVDTVDFRDSLAGVTVNLDTSIVTGGDDVGETIANFENVVGTDGDDVLIGDAGNNRLFGLDGNDVISGGDGNDAISGGLGADTLDGGDGFDTVIYSRSAVGVMVNLATSVVSGADAGETIANFENVVGSKQDDVLMGDGNQNNLRGKAGNDDIFGGAGKDSLDGDDGADTLEGGADSDSMKGGLGSDTFVYSALSDSLLAGRDRISDLEIGTDTIQGVSAVAASAIDQLGTVAKLRESEIQGVLTAAIFEEDTAATFTVGSRTYLAINDGADGFSASTDAIVDITGYQGDLANLSISAAVV